MSDSSFLFFKGLKLKNFRSIDNMGLSVDYKVGKTTLVASVDNGSGKSTAWRDGLYYVLFGKAYGNGQTLAQLINSRSGNSLHTSIEIQKGDVLYEIERGQKPAVFNIKMDGVALNKDAVDFQALVYQILGCDEKVFTNSIILGADKFVPFTSMGKDERRKYTDQILDLSVITKMSDLNKLKVKELIKERTDISTNLAVLDAKKKGVEDRIQLKKRNEELVNGTIKQSMADYENKIADLETHIPRIVASIESKTELRVKMLENKTADLQELKGYQSEAMKPLLFLLQEKKTALSLLKLEGVTEADQALLAVREGHNSWLVEKDVLESKLKADETRALTLKLKRDEAILRLKELVEPIVGELCVHCGGNIPQSRYDEHVASYTTKKENYEKVISLVESNLVQPELLTLQASEIKDATVLNNKILEDGVTAHQNFMAKAREDLLNAQTPIRVSIESNQAAISELEKTHLQEINGTTTKHDSQIAEVKQDIDRCNIELATVKDNISGHALSLLKLKNQLELATADNSTDGDEFELTDVIDQIETNVRLFDENTVNTNARALLTINLKDEGIKAKIVENYLPFINGRINEYLDKMNFFVNMNLTSGFELEMFAPDRKGQSIETLSTGQRRRVDLSILLAMRDVVRQAATCSCNILVLDEVLESLSESGVIDFLELWESTEESKYTNLVVISQRKAEFEPLFDTSHIYKLVDGATVEISE